MPGAVAGDDAPLEATPFAVAELELAGLPDFAASAEASELDVFGFGGSETLGPPSVAVEELAPERDPESLRELSSDGLMSHLR